MDSKAKMNQVVKFEGQFQGHKSYSCKMQFSKVEKNRHFFSSFEVSIAKEFDD